MWPPPAKAEELRSALRDAQQKCEAIIVEWNAGKTERLAQESVGMRLRHTFTLHDVVTAAWSPDGKLLACGALDGTITIFEPLSLQELCKIQFEGLVKQLAWSPDNKRLAIMLEQFRDSIFIVNLSDMPGVQIVQTQGVSSNQYIVTLINSIAWSPDSMILAIGARDGKIRFCHPSTGKIGSAFAYHKGLTCIAWSPDGIIIASGSEDATICLWNFSDRTCIQTLRGHEKTLRCLIWLDNGQQIISSAEDVSVRLWDIKTGLCTQVLEGQTDKMVGLAIANKNLLVAQTLGEYPKLHYWDLLTYSLTTQYMPLNLNVYMVYNLIIFLERALSYDFSDFAFSGRHDYENIGYANFIIEKLCLDLRHVLEISQVNQNGFLINTEALHTTINDLRKRFLHKPGGKFIKKIEIPFPPDFAHAFVSVFAMHPTQPLLITAGDAPNELALWELDLNEMRDPNKVITHYTNAKVMLIGETGVGKTGLGTVMSQGHSAYHETDSTEGRHVWPLQEEIVAISEQIKEQRELLLWDMAGQQGYRVVHQMYLDDVAVALIVFDGQNETEPFKGVYYWARALQQARRLQGNGRPQKRFLVAARTDRGGINASQVRIDQVVRECGLDGYFETSAKEGRGIAELAAAIEAAVDWDAMIKVSSSELFQNMKEFFVAQKTQSNPKALWSVDELYQAFLATRPDVETSEELHRQFEICIDRVEVTGTIKRLSFGADGRLVLLHPELLDSYASALILHVRDEPDGLGYIPEKQVLECKFQVPADAKLADAQTERLLLIAMVDDLLQRELVLREGTDLIFPAQTNVIYPVRPDPPGKAIMFDFEGPVTNVYATLAVRLIRSEIFRKKQIWKDAIEFTTTTGGICGLYFVHDDKGIASLTLFFDATASPEARRNFEDYVAAHLERNEVNPKRRRLYICPKCSLEMSQIAIDYRRANRMDFMNCPACDTKILLLDGDALLTSPYQSRVDEIDESARQQKERDERKTRLDGRREVQDYDVFFCYNVADNKAVKAIAHQLEEHDILPWLFEIDQRGGTKWLEELQKAIGFCKMAGVIFWSEHGLGQWQQEEIDMLIPVTKHRLNFLNIPVILPTATTPPAFPPILTIRHQIDFRQPDPDPLAALIFAITGKRI